MTVELLLAGIRESSPGRDRQHNCAQQEGKAGGGQEVGRWRGTWDWPKRFGILSEGNYGVLCREGTWYETGTETHPIDGD